MKNKKICLVFRNGPPTPPSYAAQHQNEEKTSFVQSLLNLVKNRSFVLLLLAYGINVGVFYAISTLLSEIILTFYEVTPFYLSNVSYFALFYSSGCGQGCRTYRLGHHRVWNGWLCVLRICSGSIPKVQVSITH